MTLFRITIANRHFRSCADHEADDITAALIEGTKGALTIGRDEVCNGEPYFAAEIIIEDGSEVVGRRIVSVGCSPLT